MATDVKVFISYAREDEVTARKLYADLQRAGVRPWMDKENLLPGQHWKTAIQQAIRQSDYVIVLLSSRSVSKRAYVQKEVRAALEELENIPVADIYVIPARVDECEVPYERLQDLHWVDLFPSYTDGLAKIFLAMEIRPPLPPPSSFWKPARIVLALVLVSALLLGGMLFNNSIGSFFFRPTPTPIPTVTPAPTPTAIPTVTPAPTPTAILMLPAISLRSEPKKVSTEEAEQVFKVKKAGQIMVGWWYYKPLEYIQNTYEKQGEVVIDHTTGLMWQKSGSDESLTYKDAQKYVEELNRQKFAGYDDWRLPTIPELMSLLEPEKQSNNLYINPIFDSSQSWCWSADRHEWGSSGAAWLVNFINRLVSWLNVKNLYYVRCVRSRQ